jgi:hypothetical protein
MISFEMQSLVFWNLADCPMYTKIKKICDNFNNLSTYDKLKIDKIYAIDGINKNNKIIKNELMKFGILLQLDNIQNIYKILNIVEKYPPPYSVILIGNDRDYIPLINILKVRGYYIISIYYSEVKELLNIAHKSICWNNFMENNFISDINQLNTDKRRLYNRSNCEATFQCYIVEFFNNGIVQQYHSEIEYKIGDIVKVQDNDTWDIGRIINIENVPKKSERNIIKKIEYNHFDEILSEKIKIDNELLSSYINAAAKIIPNIKLLNAVCRWDRTMIDIYYINVDFVQKKDLALFAEYISGNIPIKLNYVNLHNYTQ